MSLILVSRENGRTQSVALPTIEAVAAYVADHALIDSLWADIAGERLRTILTQQDELRRVTAEYNEIARLLGMAVKEAIG